jgi:hypothetical protein
MGYALAKYSLLHIEYMGFDGPMPRTSPKPELLAQTFENFLTTNGLRALIGILQYGYEVQGYGPLDKIPAYYGLLWITPAITWAALLNALRFENVPVVTAWSKGWGDVWKQIVEKMQANKPPVKITFSAQTTKITRTGKAGVAISAKQSG